MEADRFPDTLAGGADPRLVASLEALLGPGRVTGRAIDLVAYASDASPYRLQPQAVVIARDAGDVAKVFAFGRERGIPVTLRGGGTSLNGQAQTSGILVDVRRHFRGVRVLEDGAAVRVSPGTVLGHVDRVLHAHQRRIGPDPASTDIATVGGVIATGHALRPYAGRLLDAVLADVRAAERDHGRHRRAGRARALRGRGTRARAGPGPHPRRDPLRRAPARTHPPQVRDQEHDGLPAVRVPGRRRSARHLRAAARRLGGTLAFIGDAVFETVEHGHHTSTGLAFFDSIEEAARPVPKLVAASATAVELMINASLIAASWTLPGMPEEWRELSTEGAVLLVELRTTDPAQLDALEAGAHEALPGLDLSRDPGHRPRRPEVHAADRGGRSRPHVHRVRLLRADLPVARPHDDAAPAHRDPP